MITVGEKIPDVTFKDLRASGLGEVTTGQIFSDKRVLLVGIPGAFTPVCSGNHLPSYVKQADKFHDLKIDEIACIAVNDAFVMKAFGDAQQADGKVLMLADGDAEFTRKIGMDVDASTFGLGTRSKRYAMIINNGIVEAVQAEDHFVDLGVSSADHMLEVLEKA